MRQGYCMWEAWFLPFWLPQFANLLWNVKKASGEIISVRASLEERLGGRREKPSAKWKNANKGKDGNHWRRSVLLTGPAYSVHLHLLNSRLSHASSDSCCCCNVHLDTILPYEFLTSRFLICRSVRKMSTEVTKYCRCLITTDMHFNTLVITYERK